MTRFCDVHGPAAPAACCATGRVLARSRLHDTIEDALDELHAQGVEPGTVRGERGPDGLWRASGMVRR